MDFTLKNITCQFWIAFFIGVLSVFSNKIDKHPKHTESISPAMFETITPRTQLLWYSGFIGDYPIKLMLKRTHNRDASDSRITDIAYAYDSQKKWIFLEEQDEFKSNFFGSEVKNDGIYAKEKFEGNITGSWEVPFIINTTLNGLWYDKNGKPLTVKLTPMYHNVPSGYVRFDYYSDLEPTEITKGKDGLVVEIKQDDRLKQTIYLDPYTEDMYNTVYVDFNYDGYLDLVFGDMLFLYNPKTGMYEKSKASDRDEFPELDELYNYNIYDKSFTVREPRTMTQYASSALNIIPKTSNSYFHNDDGDIVTINRKYINGNWEIVEEWVEKMEENDDVDIFSAVNYDLLIDLKSYHNHIYFDPNFHNNTGIDLEFKEKAKLFVEITDSNGKKDEHYLHEVQLLGEAKDMLNDNEILFDGKEYMLANWDGPIPFFPANLKNGAYQFQLIIKHPLFEEVRSKNQTIALPLDVKKAENILQLKGNINKKVNGKIYFIWNDTKVKATFINSKTQQRIKLIGTVINGKLNLTEYEKDDVVSGYFEGKYYNGIYKGLWVSPDRKTNVPFEFKQN
ncbi:hypothetical protein QSV08_09770 [Maribacter sp. BPC-D8]|uniref:hypothetical protein n=1 Tax=Maribacter sp. BPC-D8 TaxID=3053613 RepID=UPI002B4944F1|nr:hypothetical protein [Maribacter sp. BPC-D8]WRI31523.1 hypothetical protein QSV08_09770 [Maribacter sp. BPC-D8]